MKFVHGVILALMFSVMIYVVNRDMAQQDFRSAGEQPPPSLGLVQAAYAAEEQPAKMDWRMLRELNYRTGKVSPSLKALDGKLVKIPGYMVPLEDDSEVVSEFLLVPYVGACIHTPPPPPNQIVQVKYEPEEGEDELLGSGMGAREAADRDREEPVRGRGISVDRHGD